MRFSYRTTVLLVAITFCLTCGTNSRKDGVTRRGSENPTPSASSSSVVQLSEPSDSFDDDAVQPTSVYVASRDYARFVVNLDEVSELEKKVKEIVSATPPIGVMEQPVGSNRGPEVDEYLEYCKAIPPEWWCAAFVSYHIHKAAESLPLTPRWPKYAYCDDIFHWAEKHSLLMDEPLVPSVFLIPNPNPNSDRKYVHTGIVIAYDATTRKLSTVEGNANDNHSTNGVGVFKLSRTMKSGIKFVKIV